MIRKMTAADAPDVHRILVESLHYACEAAVVRSRIDALDENANHIVLVSEDDATGHVVGFIHAERYETLHDAVAGWNVIALAVLPQMWGHGIGKALLSVIESYAAAVPGSFVRLNSRVERTEAHQFYEHLGYQNSKVQKYFIKRF